MKKPNSVDRLLHEIRDGWLTADQRQERIQQLARINAQKNASIS